MKKDNGKRWRLFANVPVQGGLLVRVFLYWAISQFAMLATIALFYFLSNGEGSIANYLWPACIVSFLVLPMVMLDMVKFSNRFAGPVVNISKNLKRLANYETVDSIRLRPGDFFQDLSTDLNKIIAERMPDNSSGANPTVTEPAETKCHV